MRKIPAIPNLPPLSSISDPSVRQALQALYDTHRVRNGETGDGANRFLTAADLNDAARSSANVVGGRPGSQQAGETGWLDTTWLNNIISRVENQVLQSRLWKELGERITWIELPDWFQNRFGAAIKTEQDIRESSDRALASQFTTAVSRIDQNIALARQEITVVSDRAGASAQAVTQLQNDVGGVRTAAREALSLATSIDGRVKGTWDVKFDYNGYVTGAGLGLDAKGGTATSIFLVRADKFAVGTPQHPNIEDEVLFTVQTRREFLPDGTPVEPGIYLNRAFIRFGSIQSAEIGFGAITESRIQDLAVTTAKLTDASITTAKIDDLAVTTAKINNLAVDTLKIAGEAVMVPYNVSGTAATLSQQVIIPWTGGPGTRLIIIHSARGEFGTGGGDAGPNYGTVTAEIRITGNGLNNTLLGSGTSSGYGNATITHMGTAVLGNGTYTITLNAFAPVGRWQNAVIMAAKR